MHIYIKKKRTCYLYITLFYVQIYKSQIFGVHIELQAVPARRWTTVVLPVLVHAMLSTLFWSHHFLGSVSRLLPLAFPLASVCIIYGRLSSGWTRWMLCANLSRRASKANCISVDHFYLFCFCNSIRSGAT